MKQNSKINSKNVSLLISHQSVPPPAHWSQDYSVFVSAVSYWGHLVVEFWQCGIRAQIGGVFLEELQLFVKPVLIFFTAIPATTHRAVQRLTSLAPPLKNHHLKVVFKSTSVSRRAHTGNLTHIKSCIFLPIKKFWCSLSSMDE